MYKKINLIKYLKFIYQLLFTYTYKIKKGMNFKMDNNVLIISEKDQKAYLPYKYEDLEKILHTSNNKYNSIKEIIEDLYILPLDHFKNASFSRFREAFNLILYKEKRFYF